MKKQAKSSKVKSTRSEGEQKPVKVSLGDKSKGLWYMRGWVESGSSGTSGSYSNRVMRFSLDDRETAQVRVLTPVPVSIYRHFVGGRSRTCAVNGCKFCETGNRPTLRFLFLVVDRRKFTGSSGQVWQNEVKVLEASKALAELLKEVATDITAQDIKIKRVGKGTDTQYMITPLPKKAEPKVNDKKLIEETWKAVLKEYEPPSEEEQEELLNSEQ